MAKKAKKTGAGRSAGATKLIPAGRKAGESQLDFVKIETPKPPPVKR